jgi:hypothetical protein
MFQVLEINLKNYAVSGENSLNKSNWNRVKKILRVLGIIVPIGVWVFFLAKQMGALKSHPWELSGFGLAGSLIFSTLYFLFMPWAWALLLKKMDDFPGKKPYVSQAMRAWLLTIMSRYIPGNIWHILGRAVFAETLKMSKLRIISSGIVEQGLGMLGAMLLAVLSLPFWIMSLHVSRPWFWFLMVFPVLLASGFLVLHPRILGAFMNWAGRRFNRPELNFSLEYGTLIKFVLLYALGSAILGCGLVALLAGLGASTANHVMFILGASAMGWITGTMVFISPSGLGVREGVLTGLLALVYPLPIAIAASLLFRIITMMSEFAALLIFMIWHRLNE